MLIPPTHNPKFRVSSIILEHDGKYLFLKRSATKKIEPNTWNFPGGAANADETPLAAALRELFEETQIKLNDATFVDRLFCDFGQGPVDFQFFHVKLKSKPAVIINSESSEYAWLTLEEAKKQDLILDEDETLRLFEIWKNNQNVY
jgi:8-oxo-dGTP diphosphatase